MDISFAGVHPIIQKNWDKQLTLKQNYEKLGLIPRLNGDAGGNGSEAKRAVLEMKRKQELKDDVEWRVIEDIPTVETEMEDTDEKMPEYLTQPIEPSVQVDSRILKIGKKVNLKSVIPMDEEEQEQTEQNPIIMEMERLAQMVEKLVRHASEQEVLVFKPLVQKYGDNYEAMSRDIKLNKYQLSSGQLKRKISRWLN
jgi:nucleolar protein 16